MDFCVRPNWPICAVMISAWSTNWNGDLNLVRVHQQASETSMAGHFEFQYIQGKLLISYSNYWIVRLPSILSCYIQIQFLQELNRNRPSPNWGKASCLPYVQRLTQKFPRGGGVPPTDIPNGKRSINVGRGSGGRRPSKGKGLYIDFIVTFGRKTGGGCGPPGPPPRIRAWCLE